MFNTHIDKMKIIAILFAALSLTGCATGCREACVFGFGPGSSAFDAVASHYNKNDPCHVSSKEPGYQRPDFCYRGNGSRTSEVVRITRQGQTNTYIIDRQR